MMSDEQQIVINSMIEKYKKEHRNEIIEICYRTGFHGEDISNRNVFNDKNNFVLLKQFEGDIWRTGANVKSLIYGLRLKE